MKFSYKTKHHNTVDGREALSEMVKEIVKTGVRKALHDQKRTHRSSSKSRYNDVYDENNYSNNQNGISSGSTSDSSGSGSDKDNKSDFMKMKKKGNAQSRSQLDNRKGGKEGMKRRDEEDNMNKMRKQKPNLRSGGRFAADFTGPTGLLHARGHGQGSDKTTSYAEGADVTWCTYDSSNCP